MRFLAGMLWGALGSLALASRGSATVVAANLEYSSMITTHFFLNGVELKNAESGDAHPTDYALISSADGSFPLEALRYGAPNVLAASMKVNAGEGRVNLSYCLTLRHHDGQVLKIASRSDESRFLMLRQGKAVPGSWLQTSFDDSAWKRPVHMRMEGRAYSSPELPDPSGRGPLPFLGPALSAFISPGDSILFRQSFQVPQKAAGLRVYGYQKSGKRGEKPAFALLPDASCAALGSFRVGLQLPPGLEPVAGAGQAWDAPRRELSWKYASPARSCALNLETVLQNQGAESPHLALGPWRNDRGRREKLKMRDDYWRSAILGSGTSVWYKLSAAPFKDGPGAPVILGVTFQSQFFPGGTKNELNLDGVENFLLNYSVDGSQQGALAQDANLSRSGGPLAGGPEADDRFGSADIWMNGYYVADGDRRWTWKDLSALQLRLQAKQNGRRHRSYLLSCIASVRYYQPTEVMPRLFLQVSEAARKSLPLNAAFYDGQNNVAGSGRLNFDVNP